MKELKETNYLIVSNLITELGYYNVVKFNSSGYPYISLLCTKYELMDLKAKFPQVRINKESI